MRLDLHFPAHMRILRDLRQQMRHHLADKCNAHQLEQIQLAVSEAVQNIIVHGFGNPQTRRGRIDIHIEFIDQSLNVTLCDNAPALPPHIFSASTHSPLPPNKQGGLGIHFMCALTAQLNYRRIKEHNYLELIFEL